MNVSRTERWILAPLLLVCACAPAADEAVDESLGTQGFALNACEENGHPGTDLDRIRELLLCARDLWRLAPEIDDERERMRTIRGTFRLIHLADILAVTPGAG